DGIRDFHVTGVQTCALPISPQVVYVGVAQLDERGAGLGAHVVAAACEHDLSVLVGWKSVYLLLHLVERDAGVGFGKPARRWGVRSEERRVGKGWWGGGGGE